MEKPVLNPDFTIEDIHRLREHNHEITKDMTAQERMVFYNNGDRAFQREIEASKNVVIAGCVEAFCC